MTYDWLAPAMFVCLVIVLIAGFPVAFSLAAVAGAFGIAGILTGHFEPEFLTAVTCWPSRFLCSWEWFWSEPASLRTCCSP